MSRPTEECCAASPPVAVVPVAAPLQTTSAALRPYTWMLCGALAFATMAALGRAADRYCEWQVIALVRSSLALVFAGGLAWTLGTQLVIWRSKTLWVRSLAGSASLVCTFYAITRLPTSDVLTLTNTFPIWIALLSWPLLKEFPHREVWIALGCGIAGVLLVQQPHWATGNRATWIALLASVFSAVAMIGLHRLRNLPARAIVVHFSAVATLVCLGLTVWVGAFSSRPLFKLSPIPWFVWPLLLGMGLSATIGQLFLTRAFAAGPPAKVSVVGLTQVAFGMVYDIVLWQRAFDWTTLAGILLLVGPSAWLMLHSQSRAGKPRE